MKETQIAKENVGELKRWDRRLESHNLCSHRVGYWSRRRKCETHLKSCQRFLEFLEKLNKENLPIKIDMKDIYYWDDVVKGKVGNQIKDLQTAIKVYEYGGVR